MKIIIILLLVTASTTMISDSFDTSYERTPLKEDVQSCYIGQLGRDTVTISLNTGSSTDQYISGSLTYRFYAKDDNDGTISGHLNGDTLLADYIFMSQGMPSVRQVAFLKKDNQLLEGHGAMEQKDGKLIFKDPKHLSFINSFTLQKVRCY